MSDDCCQKAAGTTDGLTVYYTSATPCFKTKKNQDRIFSVLTSKGILFKRVDVCQNVNDRELMRKLVGNPTALAPQICNGDRYLGDMEAFEEAVECENLEAFLKGEGLMQQR